MAISEAATTFSMLLQGMKFWEDKKKLTEHETKNKNKAIGEVMNAAIATKAYLCTPNESGVCKDVVKELSGELPILGICLGQQTIAQVYGADIVEAFEPVHGKVHPITHTNRGVFKGLKNPLNVTRYHSLVVDRTTLADCFEITAETSEGEIMGIRHKEMLLEGVQFHPEAILTEMGMELLENFLNEAKVFKQQGEK